MAKKKSKTIGSRKVTTDRSARVKAAKSRAASAAPLARDKNSLELAPEGSGGG